MIDYNENEAEMENRTYRYNINRHRPRHGHKYNKIKMCLRIMIVPCIKQNLSNTKAELKKGDAYKKSM